MSEAAFYCVTGRDFFTGAVALLNSLRLLGHDQPVFVCDCGMTDAQRARLDGHATLVAGDRNRPPSTQKLVAPLAKPADVAILLDSDLIVTRPLGELIERAAGGRVIAFENDVERHFDEWSDLFGLPPLRSGPYMTSSAVFAGGDAGRKVITEMAARLDRVEPARTWVGGGNPADPLYLYDQDLFNAVALSCLPEDRVEALPAALAPIPPFAGVRIADRQTLRCRERGARSPYFLHHASHKPWLVELRTNVYSRLLTRLLLADDVAIRLDPSELPARLRTGPRARVERFATDVRLAVPGLARRLRPRPEPIPAWPQDGGR
jgi:hypothetical protein